MSLETWVMVGRWGFLDQYAPEVFLDRMEAAGVRHVAFGGTLPVVPDPSHYRDSPVAPLQPPEEVMAYAPRVRQLFAEAARRRMNIYLYGTNPHASRPTEAYHRLPQKVWLDHGLRLTPVDSYWGACANGAGFLDYYLGRVRDAVAFCPDAAGILNDGPEFGYEIAPDFMGGNWDLFTCFGPCCAGRAAALGFAWDSFRGTATQLRRWLLALDDATAAAAIARVGENGTAGHDATDALARLTGVPGVREWFDFKSAAIQAHVSQLVAGVRDVAPHLRVGIGSRTAAFAPLTGYNPSRIAPLADFVLPKLYLWMGGYDGLYGTVYRWVRTLVRWNQGLSEAVACRLVFALFGFALPSIASLADMERHIAPSHLDGQARTAEGEPFPSAFFETVVAGEVRRLIAAVGDAQRVRPWVGTSHGGRVMTPHELDLLVGSAAAAGLRTYLYYAGIEGEEWTVAQKYAAPH